MGRWATTRAVVAMLDLVGTTVGYGLDIAQIVHIENKWWLLITVSLGLLILGWVLLELNAKLNERPSINVQPIKERDTLCLLVTNKGVFASFTAQIKLESGDPSVLNLTTLKHYQGLWDTPDKIKADIPKGQSARLKIAGIKLSSLGQDMEIYYYQSPDSDGKIRANPYWRGTITNGKTGETHPLERPDAHFLTITISSTPDLKEGFFKKAYQLNYDGLVLAPKTKSR